MYTPAGRRGTFLLVAILLVISILLEQYWIAPFLPWLGQLGGVRLMFVFLDIPVRLPVIDWIPVGLLFLFFYGVVIMPGLRRREAAAGPGMLSQVSAGQLLRAKLWAVYIRWWVMLGCLLAGGGLFYLLKGYMPKAVRNGIDSFGVRADVLLPYPSGETVHLEGGMIMLIGFLIGWRVLVKKAAVDRVMPVRVPETAIRKGGIRPCVVDGQIKPAVFRGERQPARSAGQLAPSTSSTSTTS